MRTLAVRLSLAALVCAPFAPLVNLARSAPAPSPAVELANLREEFTLLQQRLGELSMRVEQLENDNARLAKTAAGAGQNYVTLTQLNTAIADLSRDIHTSSANTHSEVLATVAAQIEALAKQTNTALDSLTHPRSAPAAPVPATPATFPENFPKEGISYTVAAGDTVSHIAQKTGARLADIVNANKLTDPTKIRVGQVLFIPGGK
jgi:LysM repeat protein